MELTLQEKFKDIGIMKNAVMQFNSVDFDVIKFRCWDRDEVKFMKDYMITHHSDIPVVFSWMSDD